MSVPWIAAQPAGARRWWDGSVVQNWWDGSVLHPVTLSGWWDATATTVRTLSLAGYWDDPTSTVKPFLGGGG